MSSGRTPWPLLDLEHPRTYGPLDFYHYYYERKRQQVEAMANAQQVIDELQAEVDRRWARLL